MHSNGGRSSRKARQGGKVDSKRVTKSLRGQMQDFVNRTKFSLEEVGRGGAQLRNVEEGGETLGVILIGRKGSRKSSSMNFPRTVFKLGNRRVPIVQPCCRANVKS